MKKLDNNVDIKNITKYIAFTFILLAFAIIFSDELHGIFGVNNYVAIHLIIEIIMIVFTMSIAIQLWLTTRFQLLNKDIYMGALFTFLAIIIIAHAIAYKGMPFFITESSPYAATWFYIGSRLLLPIGLLSIFLIDVKKTTLRHRFVVFSMAILIAIAYRVLIYLPTRILPPLVIEGIGTTSFKNVLQFTALCIQVFLIIYLLRHFRAAPRRSVLFITGSIYLILSDMLFVSYKDVYDIKNFMGHIFQLFAYIVFFRTIYYSVVENPFYRLMEAIKNLELSEKEMHNMAYYDEITKLPNERFLFERLNEKLSANDLSKTLIVFKIDRLSTIKASLGSFYSEKLLQLFTERLQNIVPSKYFISKLRIDQFVLFINGEMDRTATLQLCKDLQKAMEEPFQIQHFSLVGSLHIGIARYPQNATSSENLLKHAQFAMYEARQVPEQILSYHPSMTDVRTARVILENDLYRAIQNDELFLEYQPQLNIQTGEIVSMEALVRWNHPDKGRINPAEFIPIAEQSGLIIPFGRWVLENACRQTKELHQSTNSKIKVAVNLSLGQLFQENFVSQVQEILNETKLEPQFLELEITESMTMNKNHILPILHEIKKIGITIAIDDFGTGYSSLSYLNNLPIDCLKIDRSFVSKIQHDTDREPLVDMIISMAKHLNLKVVAEGIETVEQLNYLIASNCEVIQGYLISRPIGFEKLVESLNDIQNKSTAYVSKKEIV